MYLRYSKVFPSTSTVGYTLVESHPGRLRCCLPACLPSLPLVHAVATDRSTRLTEEWNPFVQCDATVEILLVDSTLHLVHIVCDRNPGRDHACRRWGGVGAALSPGRPQQVPKQWTPFFSLFSLFSLLCYNALLSTTAIYVKMKACECVESIYLPRRVSCRPRIGAGYTYRRLPNSCRSRSVGPITSPHAPHTPWLR